MKKLLLAKRTKWCYCVSVAIFIGGLVMILLNHERIGTSVAIFALAFAIGVARENQHITEV